MVGLSRLPPTPNKATEWLTICPLTFISSELAATTISSRDYPTRSTRETASHCHATLVDNASYVATDSTRATLVSSEVMEMLVHTPNLRHQAAPKTIVQLERRLKIGFEH